MSTILLVDDEPDVRLVSKVSLETAGHAVTVADSGAAALEALGSSTLPDMVLLDVGMPGVDGWDVLTQIRSSPRTADLPVVIFTAWTTARTDPRYDELGRPPLLLKPFDREDLLAIVADVLGDAG